MSGLSASLDSPGSSRTSASGRFLAGLIFVLLTAAVLCALFGAEAQTGDSLNYARSIRSGTGLFHPHHLLFNPIIRGVWKAIRVVFPSAGPLDAAQAHNTFWALVVLAAVFGMIRRMTSSPAATVLLTLALFVSLGFWQYATLAEVYLPTMGCLVLLLAVLHPKRSTPLSAGRCAVLVGLFCLAVLYNQISVLFAIPLSYLASRRLGRNGWMRAAGLIAVSGAIVLAAYGAAFLTTAGLKTISGFVHWCLSYAFYPDPRWGTLSNISLMGGAKILLSLARNFFFVPPALFLPAAVFTGLVLGALVLGSLRAVIRRAPEAEFRLALLLWLVVTVAFIWWFTPYGYELYIPLLPLFFLLAGRLFADRSAAASGTPRTRRILFGVSVAVLAAWGALNLFAAILPAHADRGKDYARAEQLQASAPAESVLIADFELRENLLYYFDRTGTLETGPLLYSFYRHWTLEPENVPEKGRPILFPVSFAVPESVAAKPYNGQSHPEEWRSFIEWLLDAEVRDGKVVSARVPSVLPGLPGYILLSGESRPVRGLREVFGRLDELSAADDPAFSGAFSAWLARHPGLAR